MKTKLKQTKGITLIALIITIIILLILAMVTIRILMNQGIIKHAQNATAAYNDAQNNETEYLTYAEGEMDKYAGAAGGGSGGDTYTPPAEDLDALRRYFLGVKEDGSINEEGQSIEKVYGEDGFVDDEKTIGQGKNIAVISSISASKDGKFCYFYYVKYKGKDAYRLLVDESGEKVKDVTFAYHPEGIEGQKREYKGEQWTVLYDKGDTLQLVSPKIIGSYHVGINDPSSVGNTEIDKAIDSYNNVVTRLNNYCRTTLGDNTARCVGSDSNSPDNDDPGMYTSDKLANWAEGTYNGKGKKGREAADEDFIRMAYYGVNIAKDAEGNATSYWNASREIVEREDWVGLGLLAITKDGYSTGEDGSLWYVNSNGSTSYSSNTFGVRAIVTVAK